MSTSNQSLPNAQLNEFVTFLGNNYTQIIIVILIIVVVYLNIKINDLDYKFRQTLINFPIREDRSYNTGRFDRIL